MAGGLVALQQPWLLNLLEGAGKGRCTTGPEAVPRLKASNETFRNDPLVQEDADARHTYAQQWRRHKSHLRAMQHQMAKGTVDLYPKSRAIGCSTWCKAPVRALKTCFSISCTSCSICCFSKTEWDRHALLLSRRVDLAFSFFY